MAHIIMTGGPPRCPLCDNRMKEIITEKKGYFYICIRPDCMISINKNDPSINKWKEVTPSDCQLCHKPMKLFFRKDGFLKMQCRDKSHYPYQIMRGDAKMMGKLTYE